MRISLRIKKANISLYLVVSGMWTLFIHEFLKSFGINTMTVAYGGFFILFAALLIELKNRALTFVGAKYRLWILGLWVFSCFALIYGILNLHELRFLTRDIWPYSYFACFLIAARTNRWQVIDKMIYQQFMIGLVTFIYIGLTIDIAFQRNIIELNTETWNSPRIYWAWGLLYGWQYMFLSFNKELPAHRKAFTLVGICLFIVFGIIMLKRQMIIEIFMITAFKLVYLKRIEKTTIVKLGAILTFIVLFVTVFVRFYETRENISYFDAIVSRFTSEGSVIDTALKNTRLLETPLNIYKQATRTEIIWGQGLGSTVEKDQIVDSVVESGLFTIFMKGGIIFLIIWYTGFFLILKDLSLTTGNNKLLFGLLSAMFILPSAYAPFFISFPSSGYQMFWLGRCVSRLKMI